MSDWSTVKPFVPTGNASLWVRRANAPKPGPRYDPPELKREPLYMKRGEPRNIPRFNEYGLQIPKRNVESYMPGLANTALLWSANYNAYTEAAKKRNAAVAAYESQRQSAISKGPPPAKNNQPRVGMKRVRRFNSLLNLTNNANREVSNAKRPTRNSNNHAKSRRGRKTRRANRKA